MKSLPATWKAVGEVLPSPAPPTPRKPRTTTDGIAGDVGHTTGKVAFHSARHQWLVLVVGDRALTRAAIAVAVVLWDRLNSRTNDAWPSIAYIAKALHMHRSSVMRALRQLAARGWVNVVHSPGHHRSNRYRIAFGIFDHDPVA